MSYNARKSLRPIVLFDMAIADKRESRKRYSPAATCAGRNLAAILQKTRSARVVFLRNPITDGLNRAVYEKLKEKTARSGNPMLIFAISLYDHVFEATQREVILLHESFPDAKIILGGPSVNTAKSLADLADFFPNADALVKGDGELVIAPLARALSTRPINRALIEGLKGVYVREGDYTYCNDHPNLMTIEEFNSLPLIKAYEELYKDIHRSGFLSLNTSRDCKYRCIFCSSHCRPQPIFWTAERVMQELRRIKSMVQQGKLPQEARNIDFLDDDFIQDQARAVKFIEMLLGSRELNNFFRFEFHATVGSFYSAGRLRTDILDGLAKINLRGVKIGTDGFHPQALRHMRKGHTLHNAIQVMQALKDRNITQTHYAILTYPEITCEILCETLETLLRCLFDYAPHYGLSINPYEVALESNGLMEGLLTPRCVRGKHGGIKRLPAEARLNDWRLDVYFQDMFHRPLTEEIMLKAAIATGNYNSVKGEDQKRIEALSDMNRAKRSCGYETDPTVFNALVSGSPWLTAIALKVMVEDLKIEFHQDTNTSGAKKVTLEYLLSD